MATTPGQITLANGGGTTNPANFTVGSYVAVDIGSGSNTVTIDVSGTWTQTGGLLVLFVPSVPGLVYAPTIRTLPQNSLVAKSNGNTSGITTGVSDSFDLGVNGAGTLYVIAGSGSLTGTVDVTISAGLGAPAKSPAAGDLIDVIITGPLGTQTIAASVATTQADGNDVTQGAKADAALANPATAGTLMGTVRGLWTSILTLITNLGSPMQNSGGSVTANAGTNLNTSLLATDAHATNVQSAPGTPQTIAVTVQGNASGIAVPTAPASNALGSPLSGQKVIAVTGTAVQGPNLAAVNGIIVTAHPLNTAFTASAGGTVGPSGVTDTVDGTGNGAFLQPGASLGFTVNNANLLYVNGFAGDKFSFGVS